MVRAMHSAGWWCVAGHLGECSIADDAEHVILVGGVQFHCLLVGGSEENLRPETTTTAQVLRGMVPCWMRLKGSRAVCDMWHVPCCTSGCPLQLVVGMGPTAAYRHPYPDRYPYARRHLALCRISFCMCVRESPITA